MADGDDDNELLLGLLTVAIVAPVAPPVDCEIAVLLLVVAICCCCYFVVVVCFGGGVAADTKGGFTVLAIPHIRASVVLTTLRLGLLGSHIFDLSSADIVGVLSELLLPAAGGDPGVRPAGHPRRLLQRRQPGGGLRLV